MVVPFFAAPPSPRALVDRLHVPAEHPRVVKQLLFIQGFLDMRVLAALRRNSKRLQNKDVKRNEQTPRVTVCLGKLWRVGVPVRAGSGRFSVLEWLF